MSLHILKLCVGAASVEDLDDWQRERAAAARKEGRTIKLWHRTRTFPKRGKEILDGGSLYWVIKGVIQVRQQILDLVAVKDEEGIGRCDIVLAPKLIRVRPVPRRAFQGWRYLAAGDAPPDLKPGERGLEGMPAAMRAELTALGLL